jgi:hypothetical protein
MGSRPHSGARSERKSSVTELRDLSELYQGKPYYPLPQNGSFRTDGKTYVSLTCSESGYELAKWMSKQKAFASIFENDRFQIIQVGRYLDRVASFHARQIELIKFQRLRLLHAKFMRLAGKPDEAKRWLERSRRSGQRRISDYDVLIINLCVVLKTLMQSPGGRNVLPFGAWSAPRDSDRNEAGGPLSRLTHNFLLEYFPAPIERTTYDGESYSRVVSETKLPGREAFVRAYKMFIKGGYLELISPE